MGEESVFSILWGMDCLASKVKLFGVGKRYYIFFTEECDLEIENQATIFFVIF